jgi:hypothetical protein
LAQAGLRLATDADFAADRLLHPSIGFLLAIEPCAGRIEFETIANFIQKETKIPFILKNGHPANPEQLQQAGLKGFGQGQPLVGHEKVLGKATSDLHQGLLFIASGVAHGLAVYFRGGMSTTLRVA